MCIQNNVLCFLVVSIGLRLLQKSLFYLVCHVTPFFFTLFIILLGYFQFLNSVNSINAIHLDWSFDYLNFSYVYLCTRPASSNTQVWFNRLLFCFHFRTLTLNCTIFSFKWSAIDFDMTSSVYVKFGQLIVSTRHHRTNFWLFTSNSVFTVRIYVCMCESFLFSHSQRFTLFTLPNRFDCAFISVQHTYMHIQSISTVYLCKRVTYSDANIHIQMNHIHTHTHMNLWCFALYVSLSNEFQQVQRLWTHWMRHIFPRYCCCMSQTLLIISIDFSKFRSIFRSLVFCAICKKCFTAIVYVCVYLKLELQNLFIILSTN